MSLTDAQILEAQQKRTDSMLSDGRGLYLQTTKKGAQRWLFRYRFEGKDYKFALGNYPLISKIEAQILASTHTAILKHPTNPRNPLQVLAEVAHSEQIQEALHINQLERQRIEDDANAIRLASRLKYIDLFELWHRQYLQRNRKDKGEEILRAFQRDVLPFLGHLFAEEIKRRDISNVLHTVVERGSLRMANVLLSDIRQSFGWAIGGGLLDNDPCSHLVNSSFGGKKVRRTRRLANDEITYLLNTALPLCNLSTQAKLGIQILLSTMARVGEMLRAKRCDINLKAREWHIPAENSKNGYEHNIHLSSYANLAFKKLLDLQSNPIWLYPNRTGTNHIDTKSLTKQIVDRQQNGAALSGRSKQTTSLVLTGGLWRSHDLRRTGATTMGELNIHPHIIDLCLNHMPEDSDTRIYQLQESLAARIHAFNTLGHFLESTISPVEITNHSSNVIQLRRA